MTTRLRRHRRALHRHRPCGRGRFSGCGNLRRGPGDGNAAPGKCPACRAEPGSAPREYLRHPPARRPPLQHGRAGGLFSCSRGSLGRIRRFRAELSTWTPGGATETWTSAKQAALTSASNTVRKYRAQNDRGTVLTQTGASEKASIAIVCLPDTVDPRGPKGWDCHCAQSTRQLRELGLGRNDAHHIMPLADAPGERRGRARRGSGPRPPCGRFRSTGSARPAGSRG